MTRDPARGTILVVDDDAALTELLADDLRRRGHRIETAANARDAWDCLHRQEVDLLLTDLNMPGRSGVDLCADLHSSRPDLPVVIMTAFGSLDTAISALRAGAYDFVTKPVDLDLLAIVLGRALQHRQLTRRIRLLDAEMRRRQPEHPLLGESRAMQRVNEDLQRFAALETSVLVHGESGTGKELAARALHRLSPRCEGPFVAINCAALPETLLESELFGHVRGAFTDARESRDGLFRQASGGTLLLDEIGDLPLALQPKLLRVLESRMIRPVGGNREIPVDVRIVAATHRDLERLVATGEFRDDLYYRLNVIELVLPPLRDRGNDVLLLAQRMLEEFAGRFGKQVSGLAEPAAAALLRHDWPGNVRELRNVMERAVALARHDRITVEDLPEKLRHGRGSLLPLDTEEELLPLAEVEARHIRRVLAAVDGNRTRAAAILGLDRKTLYRKLG